jgi:hypothetical protein
MARAGAVVLVIGLGIGLARLDMIQHRIKRARSHLADEPGHHHAPLVDRTSRHRDHQHNATFGANNDIKS